MIAELLILLQIEWMSDQAAATGIQNEMLDYRAEQESICFSIEGKGLG